MREALRPSIAFDRTRLRAGLGVWAGGSVAIVACLESHSTLSRRLDNRGVIRLIVGLGNPGPSYDATRHNAGFWFVDEVAAKLGVRLAPERGYFGHAARANAGGQTLWLLEPTTYMNESGKSVAALARFFKIEPGEILVAHDELDLLPGQVKMKLGGSHAGHNGLRDIQAQLGSADFWRLRLGIGHPGVKAEVIDYVLRRPPAEQRDEIGKAMDQALTALDLVIAGDMERATMKVHARPPKPKPPAPPRPVLEDSQGGSS